MSSAQTLYRAPMLPSNDLGNATAEIQWPNARGTPLILALPSNNSLANKSFRIRLFGRCTAGVQTTLSANFYFGLLPTIASNTQIFGSGPQLFTGSSNFNLWLDMTWDSTSQSISGIGQGQVANNVVGPTALFNTPVKADPNRDSNTFLQSGPTYGFTVTAFFGNSSAGNHAFVDDFAMELL